MENHEQPKMAERLLSRKLSRKEFLIQLGVAAAALTGVKNVVDSLGGDFGGSKKKTGGYGASTYGDAPDSRRRS